MAKLTVDLGSVIANGADGDTAREAFTKVNSNFTEVYDNLQNQSGNLDTKVDKVVGKSLVDDTEIAKLATVQANATQNNTDTYLLDRANHTGTQAISTVSGLQTAIDLKANTLDLGTAAYTDSADYATALQGSKADTAAQTADLGTAAYQDAIAFEKLLSPGAGISIDRTNPAAPIISAGGAGAGDVTGPNSSIANEVVLFDGVTGKVLRGGGVLGTAAFTNEIETVSQADAEAGVATDRRIWTAERVRQAISSWWLSASSALGRSLSLATDEAAARELLGMQGFSGRNKIINGNFLVNQREISGTVTLAAGIYGHDRWKAGSSGCTYTFSANEGVVTITISAGSLQQVIEGVNLQSGTYILSWQGTSQGKIGAGAYASSGVTGAVVGGVNTVVEFNVGTLSLVQFETGEVATPFEHRPYWQELALCQRYYQVEKVLSYATYQAAGLSFRVPVPLKQTMRASPSITFSNTVLSNSGSFTAVAISEGVFNMDAVATTAGRCLITTDYAASAEL